MNLLACATHTVADAEAAAARFADWMAYEPVERGTVDPGLAASWGAPASAGRNFIICRPASGADVFLRFVEGDAVPGYAPLRTFGWAAVELCIQDIDTTNTRMIESPFEVIGTPLAIPGIATIHPMQVRGADQEIVYLTQILTDAPDSGLPHAESAIDKPFILVCASRDIRAAARWFAETLGITVDDPIAIRYRMISQSFGLPPETLHELITARHGNDVFVEFAQYPDAATVRPAIDSALQPGFSICTLRHPDIDAVGGWLADPAPREGVLYRRRRVGTLLSPEGALIEVIEDDPS